VVAADIGQRIRRTRQREGLTQAELAEKIGVTQGAIAAWEGSRASPTEANKKKLKSILGWARVRASSEPSQDVGEEVSSFGAWLREQRLEKSLSVPELAKRANVSSPAIYNIENGKIQNPQANTRQRIAAALETAVPDMVVDETTESQEVPGLGALTDFEPHEKKDWPTCAGVYVLYDVSQRPIYVGKGDKISTRLRVHEEKFWFRRTMVEYASYIEVQDKALRHQLEQALIKFLKNNAVINKQSTDEFGGD
jgi:transcriptional regulator with XRE-family HTH domain